MSFSYRIIGEGGEGGATAWRRPRAGLSLAEIDKAARTEQTIDPGGCGRWPTTPAVKWTDAGRVRTVDPSTIKALAQAKGVDRGAKIRGKWISDHWHVVAANDSGSAIVLRGGVRPESEGIVYHSLDLSAQPVRWVTTPEWWRAYSRVRTCADDRDPVVCFDGRVLRAWSEQSEAAETLRDEDAGHWHNPADPIALSDAHLWPLRGIQMRVRLSSAQRAVWLEWTDADGIDHVVVTAEYTTLRERPFAGEGQPMAGGATVAA